MTVVVVLGCDSAIPHIYKQMKKEVSREKGEKSWHISRYS